MRNAFLIFLSLLALNVAGQNQPKKPAASPTQGPTSSAQAPANQPQRPINPFIEHFARKAALASRWNDSEQLKDAWYDLIAENPANDSVIYLLAIHYYENRQYVSAVLIAQDLLRNNPKNENVLQLAASGYEAIGLKDKALTHYETVFLINGSSVILYKMATLQFDLKKFAECKINADVLLTKKDLDSLKVSVGGEADLAQKEYPVKAAILNLKGLLALEDKDKPAAKKAFEDALVVAPDFPLAKQNLAKLK